MECHRIFPGCTVRGVVADREDAAVVETVRAAETVDGSVLPLEAMRLRLSAIVLGPLMMNTD